jgi:hypothetical protein
MLQAALRLRPIALGCLLMVVACSDGTDPGETRFTVSPATVWAGSELTVHSTMSTGGQGGPGFSLAGVQLNAQASGNNTWLVTVPTTASGAVVITAVMNGDSTALDPVTVRGFSGSHQFETGVQSNLLVWAKDGDATALTSDALNLLEVNATRSTITVHDSLMGSPQFSVGPSQLDNAFVVWPVDSTRPEVWSLAPTPQRLADVPETALPRMTMTFDDDRYLSGFGNGIWLNGAYFEGASEAEIGVMSPTHDRATLRVDWDQNDVPVFDVATGTVAFRLPGIQSTEGVAFSPDGKLLAIAGGDSCAGCGVSHVQLLRASDGEVLHDTTLAVHAWGIAFDRSRPLLYVGVDVTDSAGGSTIRPGVLVLDRDSFAERGYLASPAGGLTCSSTSKFGTGGTCYGGVLMASDEPAVYALSGFFTPKLQSWRFDTKE